MRAARRLEDVDISFKDVPEYERTKHVHRLHPYLGKFIPQLVEFFLSRFFHKGDTILDPFVGSGTTLVEGNILGLNTIGIDISPFNCLISEVKTKKYDIPTLESEIKDILEKTRLFSSQFTKQKTIDLYSDEEPPESEQYSTDSEYLTKWYSRRALKELLFFREQIHEYKYEKILSIILTRAARSARLTPHYELTRAEEPIVEPYWCHKHSRVCAPVQEAFKFLERYCLDTIERIKEFAKLRTDASVEIIRGDARSVDLKDHIKSKMDGIFTSPPYVGLIDYHEQHEYAYELLDLPRYDEKEIGPKSQGKSQSAVENYQRGITEVFRNVAQQVVRDGHIFIVVNDKHDLYQDIAEGANLELIKAYPRKVTKKASRERAAFDEAVFHFINKN